MHPKVVNLGEGGGVSEGRGLGFGGSQGDLGAPGRPVGIWGVLGDSWVDLGGPRGI